MIEKLKNPLNFFFFIVPLLTIVITMVWIFIGIGFLQGSIEIFTIFLFVILPLLILIFAGIFLIKIFKNIQNRGIAMRARPRWKAALYVMYLFFLIAISTLMILIITSFFDEDPPEFFTFNDPGATYTIIKSDNGTFMIDYQGGSNAKKTIACSYQSGSRSCKEEIWDDMQIMIGDSPIDLEQFVNRKVKISGEFVYRTDQCIAGNCREMGNMAALDIWTIDAI